MAILKRLFGIMVMLSVGCVLLITLAWPWWDENRPRMGIWGNRRRPWGNYVFNTKERGIEIQVADALEALYNEAVNEYENTPNRGLVGCVDIFVPHDCRMGWHNSLSDANHTRLCVYSSICMKNLNAVGKLAEIGVGFNEWAFEGMYIPVKDAEKVDNHISGGKKGLEDYVKQLILGGWCSSSCAWYGTRSGRLCPSHQVVPDDAVFTNRSAFVGTGRQTFHYGHTLYQALIPLVAAWDLVGGPANSVFVSYFMEKISGTDDPKQPGMWPLPFAGLQGGLVLSMSQAQGRKGFHRDGFPSLPFDQDICFGPSVLGVPPELFGPRTGGVRSTVFAAVRLGMFARIGAAGKQAQNRTTWSQTLAFPSTDSTITNPHKTVLQSTHFSRQCGQKLLDPSEATELQNTIVWMRGRSWTQLVRDGRLELPRKSLPLKKWRGAELDGPLDHHQVFTVVVDAAWGLTGEEPYERIPESFLRVSHTHEKSTCHEIPPNSPPKDSFESVSDPLSTFLPKDIECNSHLRALFVDRNDPEKSGRTFLNIDEVFGSMLQPPNTPLKCPITIEIRVERNQFGSITTIEQAALVFASDIFITIHGNEESSVGFMRPGTVEAHLIIPKGETPANWYLPVKRGAGIHYVGLHCHNAECEDPEFSRCFRLWRKTNFQYPLSYVRYLLAASVRQASRTWSYQLQLQTLQQIQSDAWQACSTANLRRNCKNWACNLVGNYATPPTFHPQPYAFDAVDHGLPAPTDYGAILLSSSEGMRVFPPTSTPHLCQESRFQEHRQKYPDAEARLGP